MKMIYVIFYCIGIIILMSCTGKQTRIPGKAYHHIEGGFRNPPGSIEPGGFSFDHILFGITRPFVPLQSPEISKNHIINNKEAINTFNSHPERDSITWIGHMTAIIRMSGQVIAIDPWFSKWAAALPPFGARRVVPPGIPLDKLPQINTIVISHNHYDHLDIKTLKKIPNPEKITVVIPIGVSRYIKTIPFKKVIELDWHESVTVNSIEYRALPVVHYSRRSISDGNKTLWAGFLIKGSTGKKIFFGEGEYGDIYKSIGQTYGPFDAALIAAGAYKPEKVMRGSHCSPENCVNIGIDIKTRIFIPVHWGTTQLSTEPFMDPGKRFGKKP